jgi:cyclohexanone monooxygenase
MPKHRYAFGAEIYEHCQRLAKHFGLYESALFSTTIRSLKWDESIKRWRVGTNKGDDIRARFVVMAAGSHSRAKLPGIPGIKSFKGHSFHTARWDYDYTGGNADGGLTKLADKRVALIGTGATGIQCTPFLAEDAKHLYIFQRTPSPVDVRNNVLTDQAWAKSLQPGWQLERQKMFHIGAFGTLSSPEEDLLCDGWAEVNRNLSARLIAMGRPSLPPEELRTIREEEDYRVMERIRRRVTSIVEDEAAAEALKPWYRFLCKRPCFNDEYLQCFNRPNVTLVDVSASKGVERITEKGIVADGKEYAVDCIIYASGFEITHDVKRRWALDAIEGRGGYSLYDHWADGLRTFHGMTSHNFPNQFFTGYSQAGQSANISATYDQQGRHIAYIISETLARGAVTVEPTQEAEDAWVKTIREKLVTNAQFWNECTPGYFNNEGATSMRAYNGEPYGGGFYAFEELTKAWRDKGDLDGLVLGK